MARDPGRLIGTGRSADVYDVGGGRVLRRYRDDVPLTAEFEASVMRHVRGLGYPAPEVFDAAGPDLVMERCDGPTLLADVGRRPVKLPAYAGLLASLHARLAALPPMDGMRASFGEGQSILHLDLHPDNVLMTADGPMVIDWPNAAVGPAAADVASTWIIMATADIPDGSVVARAGRGLFVRAFLRRAGRASARAVLDAVAEARCRDRNVPPHEAARIHRLVASHAEL